MDPSKLLLGLTLVCVAFRHGATANENFDVHVDKLERIGDSEKYFKYNYTYEKISEMKFNIQAQVEQLLELDDSYSVKGLVARANLAEDSEYEVMMNLQKPLCEWMRTIYKSYFYDELVKVSNFPHYDTCPLPVAEYTVKDYVLDAEPYSDMMSEGRWKVEMMLMKGDDVCSGVILMTTVKPKG
ncbi:uncharacterized protein LOC128721734 [Anopheles nili]|uniref:uncharacterized protein LOC128721734 n=1 Tax=Anopheles nili TaxID=185578 RepID=UPI00237B034D|nr:uncharacterized protein LOC128721734 [Anopheles nili]